MGETPLGGETSGGPARQTSCVRGTPGKCPVAAHLTAQTSCVRGTPISGARFRGWLIVVKPKRTASRAVRFPGPERAGKATPCSYGGHPSRRADNLPAPPPATRSWEALTTPPAEPGRQANIPCMSASRSATTVTIDASPGNSGGRERAGPVEARDHPPRVRSTRHPADPEASPIPPRPPSSHGRCRCRGRHRGNPSCPVSTAHASPRHATGWQPPPVR